MKTFIESVAEAYLNNEQADALERYCFVFPNKRACTMFHHHTGELMRRRGMGGVQPASMAIHDFVNAQMPTIEVDRLEAIFLLYQSYRRTVTESGGGDVDFNRFQRWADVLLSDFNDVDMALVDPSELFPNVTALREIKASYLTEAQMDAIVRAWGARAATDAFGADGEISRSLERFWMHISRPLTAKRGNNHSLGVKFVRLWQVLEGVYRDFHKRLADKGLHYMGAAYRQLAETLSDRRPESFPYRRYVFVGFSLLTPAEKRIFHSLRKMRAPDGTPMADFYWDNASPAFRHPGLSGAKLINSMVSEFPSIYQCVEPIATFPEIHIAGVSSRVGQARIAGETAATIYRRTVDEHPDASADDINSMMLHNAVVLPDEELMAATLHSMPPEIGVVNITMGYKLRLTEVASLVSAVVKMQIRGRIAAKDGRKWFLAEDVLQVLGHPLIQERALGEALLATRMVRYSRRVVVDTAMFSSENLSTISPVFSYVQTHGLDAEPVLNYLTLLLDWLVPGRESKGECRESKGDGQEMNGDEPVYDIDGTAVLPDGASSVVSNSVERTIVARYRHAVSHLRKLCRKYLTDKDINITDTTVFRLIQQMVEGETVNFKGRPLKGFQIMGVLETRSIDFENMVLTSLNEKVFPHKFYNRSLIPPLLRANYGLFTVEHNEALYSYYFYRMIARAHSVWLIYDARRNSVRGNGQMSRYIHQLKRIFHPADMVHRVYGYNVAAPEPPEVEVRKDARILAEINRYFDPSAEKPRFLSASAINQYINCPLSFYLQYIEKYKRQDEISDWIAADVYGTVVHQVFQQVYDRLSHREAADSQDDTEVCITADDINRVLASKTLINNLIVTAINEHHNKLGKDDLTPLHGEAKIVGMLIEQYVRHALQFDAGECPIYYCAGEKDIRRWLTLRGIDSDGDEITTGFNFTGIIDRIDRTGGTGTPGVLRIVDYKTGADSNAISDIDEMFVDTPQKQRAKGLLQLFIYAEAFAQETGYTDPISVRLNLLRSIAVKGFSEVSICGDKGFDYRKYSSRVFGRLIPVLRQMQDPDIPFRPTNDPHACTFCNFMEVCSKLKQNR